MNIIEQYDHLSTEGKWIEALPVIKEIIERSPEIDTSWFNYGVCLDELGKHKEASEAFIKAHELNIQDYGTHYRIIRSLSLAEDYSTLYEFIDYICQTFKDEQKIIFESSEYQNLIHREEFKQLKHKYTGA